METGSHQVIGKCFHYERSRFDTTMFLICDFNSGTKPCFKFRSSTDCDTKRSKVNNLENTIQITKANLITIINN